MTGEEMSVKPATAGDGVGAVNVSEAAAVAVPNSPKRPARRTRSGVARLPHEIRNVVNQSLRDGTRYQAISAQLDSLGYPRISRRQIGTWFRTGYREWLEQQERFDSALGQTELIAALVGKTNPEAKFDVADLNDMLVATRMHQLLQQMDPVTFKTLNSEQVGLFLRVATAISSQTRSRARRQELELKRNQFRLELRKMQLEKEGDGKEKGLSPETLVEIERAMARLS